MRLAVAIGLAGLLLAPSLYVRASGQNTTTRTVLFALQRSERLHAFDAGTLQHLGFFKTGPLGDGLGARADGRLLFLLQPSRDLVNSCCSLRALDLSTREMCWLSDFAVGQVVVSGGMVTAGSNAFNAQTLERIPIPRPGFTAFAALPSADGRFTARLDRGPVLVFTTVATGVQRSIPIPEGARAGDWFGDRFTLVLVGPGTGQLWTVSPADAALAAPRAVAWPDSEPRMARAFALGKDLVSFERFGRSLMVDRRNESAQPVPGGAMVIPSTAGKARRIVEDIYLTALIPGLDGRSLYAVEAGPREGPAAPVRVLRIDTPSGKVVTSVVLNDATLFPDAAFDVWSLAIAEVPVDLVPRGETALAACRR